MAPALVLTGFGLRKVYPDEIINQTDEVRVFRHCPSSSGALQDGGFPF